MHILAPANLDIINRYDIKRISLHKNMNFIFLNNIRHNWSSSSLLEAGLFCRLYLG